jgi:4-amino-4-deoxy-L-arabinose transferase-like glycosyltransferase
MGSSGDVWGGRRVLLLIVACALLARLILTPLHVDHGVLVDPEPRPYEYCPYKDTVPFDYYGYICPAQRILEGKSVYANYSIHRDQFRGFPYPPASPLIWAAVVHFFGPSFPAMKVPSVLFDCGIIVLVYLIAEGIFGGRPALIAAGLYASSYIFVLNSGAFGNDDESFMFFTMLAILLAMRGRLDWSGAAVGVGLFFKLSTVLFIPPILYYVYSKRGAVGSLRYCAALAAVLALLLSPFLAREGLAVLYPYNVGKSMTIDGWGVLNVARLAYGLPFHALHPEMRFRDLNPGDPLNYDGTHPFMGALKLVELPVNFLGFAIAAGYVLRYRLKSAEVELLRNTVVFISLMLIFSKSFYDQYFLWFIPYLIIIFSAAARRLGRVELVGAGMAFGAALIFAAVWTMSLWRPIAELLWLWAGLALAVCGSYLLYYGLGKVARNSMILLMFVCAYSNMMNAVPFMVFYPLVAARIGQDFFRQITYYGGYLLMAIFVLAAMCYVLRTAHRASCEADAARKSR